MSTDEATKNVEQHEAKVAAGEKNLQAQSEQKLAEMSTDTAKDNEESKPKSAADDQPDDSDPS